MEPAVVTSLPPDIKQHVAPENDAPPKILTFEPGDPTNPYNWPNRKKIVVIVLGSLIVLNTCIASALPSLAQPAILRHFNVQQDIQGVLPNSIFLVGYVVGPLLWAPMSEHYGRRWTCIGTFVAYTAFMVACAVAPNWASFIVFRFLDGLLGAAPLSLTGGQFADVLDDPVWRGRSISWFMTVATMGPVLGPVISGCLVQFGWEWPFWFGTIFAGACVIPLVLFLPETFGPALLKAKARKIRKEQPGANVYAPLELQHVGALQLVTRIVGRPLRMMVLEPIVSACCCYLSLMYATIFILFQCYAVIYPPIYGFGPLKTGLAFLPVVLGAALSFPIGLWFDGYISRAKAAKKPWASKEEYQRLPLACLGGPLMPIGMFWIGWSARTSIHWIVPILGGLPFGIGFVLVFVALFNYIVDAYKIYAASALGATSIARSIFGVVLPFAAKPMYASLGVAWACSLLGFASLLMCAIPFVFIQFGPVLRARSPICQELATPQRQHCEEEKV